MVNRSREKVALIVFLILVIVGFGGLASYLAVGHTWNVAASNIDDATGSMEGYTTIIFKGLTPPAPTNTQSKTPSSSTQGATAGSSSTTPSSSDPSSDGSDSGANASASSGGSAANPSVSTENSASSTSPSSESSSSSTTAPTGTDAAASAPGTTTTKKPALTVADVQKNYEDKNATVFSIDVETLSLYGEGLIIQKGTQRFGIFSIVSTDSLEKIEKQIEYFKSYKVDFIVAVVPEKRLVTSISGIDIVISTANEDLFVMGETIKGTFYVDSPEVGSVGVILISPSRVVSAKVIQEL